MSLKRAVVPVLECGSSDGGFCHFHFISSKTWLSAEKLLDNMVDEKGPPP